MEGTGIRVEGMGISDFGMQIAGKEGLGCREKQFAVDGWQFTGKAGSDARCRIQDAGASRQFPALHYSNIFA